MGGSEKGWGCSNIEYVYFIKAGDFVKIGRTTMGVSKRMETFQTGSPYIIEMPFSLKIYKRTTCTHIGEKYERLIHKYCEPAYYRGEWFHYPEAVELFIENMDRVKHRLEIDSDVRFFAIVKNESEANDTKYKYRTKQEA